MPALTAYRDLLRVAGPLYVVVAFLGRLPAAMSQMGALLLVSGATGTYAAGGAAAGALAVSNAACSPLAGALADRVGQRRVVLAQSLLGGGGLVVLVLLAEGGASAGALVVASAAAGAAVPQVGPLARVRWRPLTSGRDDQPRLVEAAFSYEGAADEASFVLGPALLGAGVALADPAAALLGAAALLVVFGSWFALHPSARVRVEHGPHGRGRLLTPAFLVLAGVQLFVGGLFGSVQTGTSVLAEGEGALGAAGGVHALLGVGSVLAGLAVVALPARFPLHRRLLAFTAALVLLSAPLLAVDSLVALAAVVLVLGCAVAPSMITTFTLGERAAPPARVGAAMTLLASATGVGYALGAALAGRLADEQGYAAAFAVTVAATGCAALLALVAQPVLGRVAAPAASAAPASCEVVAAATAPDDVVADGAGAQADVVRPGRPSDHLA